MKDRIRKIMESQHMTQQVFSDFIGINAATLSGIFTERTKPTLAIVDAIKKKIPDISTDWLLFGNGQMYQSSSASVDPSVAMPESQPGIRSTVVNPMIDFGPSIPSPPQKEGQLQMNHHSVRNTPQTIVREEVKFIDKPQRRVTEIRVYYDDQTWESFVPSKK